MKTTGVCSRIESVTFFRPIRVCNAENEPSHGAAAPS